MRENRVPVWQKYTLSIEEAAYYDRGALIWLERISISESFYLKI